MKRKEKRKNTRKGSGCAYFVVFFVVLVITAICAINSYAVIKVCNLSEANASIEASSLEASQSSPALSKNEKIESTFLSTGLSIIGVAIAVWAGLNIINAIKSRDMKDIEEKYEAINEKYNDIGSIQNTLEEYYINQSNVYISSLLFNLSQYDNVMNQYLYKSIEHIQDFLPGNVNSSLLDILSRCNEVELMNIKVCKKHYSLQFSQNDSFYQKIVDYITEAENRLNSYCLKSNEIKQIIEKYLKIRKSDVLFYSGYVLDTKNIESLSIKYKNKIIKNFAQSIQIYNQLFGETQFDIEQNQAYSYSELFKLYLHNTYGESYSKIIEVENYMPDMNEQRQLHCARALTHFENVMNLMENGLTPKIERYYRNYGYALKRIYQNGLFIDTTNLDLAKYCFQQSMKISLESGSVIYKAIRGWLRMYDDEMRIKLLYIKQDSEYVINLKLSESLSHTSRYEYIDYSKKSLGYIFMTSSDIQNKAYFYKMKAFAERNLFLLHYFCDKKVAYEYKEKFFGTVYELKSIYSEKEYDDYMKELSKNLKQIESM